MATQQPAGGLSAIASRVEWAVALLLTVWVVTLHVTYLFHAGPLWRDECGTIAFASMPFGEMWDHLQYDNFPPFFEWIARIWLSLFSASDFSFRILGLIVGLTILGVLWFSARLLGARTPLLALAFFALNPLALRVGDSMRPYGLGFALVILTIGVVWKFVTIRNAKWFVIASVVATLAVQCLYQNAFYIAIAVLAAAAVCLWKKDRKTAGKCFAIGAIAALFFAPHLPNIHKGGQVRDITRVPVGYDLLSQAFNELLTAAKPLMQPVYLAVFVTTLVVGLFVAFRFKKLNVIYAVVVIVLAVLFQFTLLMQLGLPPRSWYFLILLGPLMLCADGIWSALGSRVQISRIALVLAVATVCASACWSGVQLRQTNIDLIAAKLKAEKKPGDIVLAAAWFNGVSLCRYYPQTNFTTLPPMEEIRIHRYDLMKRAMQSPDPIGPLETQIIQTLRSGHTLWIVGSLKFPQPGETVSQFPPYHTGIGINDAAYYYSWSARLGKLVQEHALKGDIVTPAAPGPVNPMENINLIAVTGWHD